MRDKITISKENIWMGLLVDSVWLRKESLNKRMYPQDLQKAYTFVLKHSFRSTECTAPKTEPKDLEDSLE